MKGNIRFEFYNILSSKKFIFCFLVNMLMCLGANVVAISDFWGRSRVSMRSCYDMSLVMPYAGINSIWYTFVLLLPIIGGGVYSDSFYNMKKNNITNYVFTRVNPKRNIYTKEIVIMIVSFIIVVIPLTVNFLINTIVFETVGRDNNYSLPSYDIGIQNYHPGEWMEFCRIQNPLKYIILKIIMTGLVAASLAVFVYAISFVTKITDKNQNLPIIIVFLIYNVMETLPEILDNKSLNKICLSNYLYSCLEGLSSVIFVTELVGILLISNIIIYIYGRKNWCEGTVYDD